ncbi:helix-turn-helix domain-containing protein [Nocardia sp. NPDC058519]|uniref:helix-turn-helix domain-containing protein n=1 Tax=Nocardia sp. NPDC058519 TaxID=3346535 RepID=UPI00364F5510
MSEFKELRRQLRIAYGTVIDRARTPRWPVQSKFASEVGLTTNTFRRIELGEREVTAPELDVIEMVLGVNPGSLRAEAWKLIQHGEIPTHAERAAETWRRSLNPKRRT